MKRVATVTVENVASELLAEGITARTEGKTVAPKKWAFIAALDARGRDARTRQFKHYDAVIAWMTANWPELNTFGSEE